MISGANTIATSVTADSTTSTNVRKRAPGDATLVLAVPLGPVHEQGHEDARQDPAEDQLVDDVRRGVRDA